jgi:hypothetical protein
MLFNVLHCSGPDAAAARGLPRAEAWRPHRVIHWVHDAQTPRGPDLAIRPRPDQCRRWLEEAGCEILIPFAALPPWHYGVVAARAMSGEQTRLRDA